jgi:hypothetical protein
MFYSMRSGGKCQKGKLVTAYTSPVIPEALENLYGSVRWGLLCFLPAEKTNHSRLMICCSVCYILNLWLFVKLPGFLPLLPQPETDGLTAISRANCLSEASFCTADVHLFGSGFPRSGQGIGAHFSAYSFCASKKSKATAGGATPGFIG